MDFSGKRILIVGIARSGMAAIKALHKKGAILTAYDAKAAADLKNEIEILHELGVEVFAGNYPPVSQAQDMLVVSPGVPLDIELIQKARKEDIQVIGELELAYLLKSPRLEFLAITGTNGKTTTTICWLNPPRRWQKYSCWREYRHSSGAPQVEEDGCRLYISRSFQFPTGQQT